MPHTRPYPLAQHLHNTLPSSTIVLYTNPHSLPSSAQSPPPPYIASMPPSLQNNRRDCTKARLLVLDLRTLDGEGMGGVVLHAAGSVAQAYHLGRTAVLSDHPLPYSVPETRCTGNQWHCWLQVNSKRRCDEHQKTLTLSAVSAVLKHRPPCVCVYVCVCV